MIALDTSVIVRALTRDDKVQFRRAAEILRSGPVGVSKTVLLETEWVLRSAYEFELAAINRGLQRLIGLENLEVEDRLSVLTALKWHAAGMDFADALHLASSARAAGFATFDRSLSKLAVTLGANPMVRVL